MAEVTEPDIQPIKDRMTGYKGLDIGPGWLPLVVRLNEQMAKVDPDYRVMQVKEKFGALRYYYFGSDDLLHERLSRLVDDAEKKSVTICERCGKEGKLRMAHHWWFTMCDEHAEERERNRWTGQPVVN